VSDTIYLEDKLGGNRGEGVKYISKVEVVGMIQSGYQLRSGGGVERAVHQKVGSSFVRTIETNAVGRVLGYVYEVGG